jgi:hypothetical protein
MPEFRILCDSPEERGMFLIQVDLKFAFEPRPAATEAELAQIASQDLVVLQLHDTESPSIELQQPDGSWLALRSAKDLMALKPLLESAIDHWVDTAEELP